MEAGTGVVVGGHVHGAVMGAVVAAAGGEQRLSLCRGEEGEGEDGRDEQKKRAGGDAAHIDRVTKCGGSG